MENKLYVGNLPYSTQDADLVEIFEQFGPVLSAKVMMDRETGRSKGFAFVEMQNAEDAQAAVQAMSNYQIENRTLRVNIAQPKTDRPFKSGGGFGGGYNRRSYWSKLIDSSQAELDKFKFI